MYKKYKPRILFAISNLTYGGIQTQALSLAKAYKKEGFKVYFFYTDKKEQDFVNNELKNYHFHIIDGRFINDKGLLKFSYRLQRHWLNIKAMEYWSFIRTIWLLKIYKIDYVIPYQNQLSNFFGAIQKYTGVRKTIFHIRNTVLEDKPKENWYLHAALKNKPTIVANSNHARSKFESVYGRQYNLNLHTIYNGIDIRPIDNTINWKSFFGVESADFIVSTIANFFDEKDFITIFKAWKGFLDITRSNSTLLVAGDEGIKGRRKYYETEVERMGLKDQVVFLGRIPQNIELLSIVDCNILSSGNEGLPNSVIETLAMGKPFLGTNIDGIREVVGQEYPLSLFQYGNAEQLESNLLKIFNKEVDLNQVKKYSLERFNIFSVDNLINNYSRLLNIK